MTPDPLVRASCVRELEQKMYRGHFHYFTGPKGYYPNKAMDSSPPLQPSVTLIEEGIARMTLKETKDMREFATSLRRSVRQHSVKDKSEKRHCPSSLCHIVFVKRTRAFFFFIGHKLVFSEAYQDDRNSPHTIIDRARIDEIINDASGLRSYKVAPSRESGQNERLFKGGDNSDIDSEDSSKMNDPTKGPMRIRVFFSTRSGRLATRLQLF